ncbi:MAG: hypothetical protein FJ087_19605 [Deltaproteobacteria bacterium]|nr:hypothetical protein [Deltaproteobacteria bacterium]
MARSSMDPLPVALVVAPVAALVAALAACMSTPERVEKLDCAGMLECLDGCADGDAGCAEDCKERVDDEARADAYLFLDCASACGRFTAATVTLHEATCIFECDGAQACMPTGTASCKGYVGCLLGCGDGEACAECTFSAEAMDEITALLQCIDKECVSCRTCFKCDVCDKCMKDKCECEWNECFDLERCSSGSGGG